MIEVVAALNDRFMRTIEEAGLTDWRRQLLTGLSGTVLEIGAGTGRNVALYPAGVERVLLCEPNRHMRARLARVAANRVSAEVVDATGEHLPLPDESVDGVLSTLVLCSVADPEQVLREIVRVLRPGGTFAFIEHVAAADRPERLAWQRRVEPVWRRVAGNCHLTRQTEAVIAASGLRIDDITRAGMRRAPSLVRTTIRGLARKPAA